MTEVIWNKNNGKTEPKGEPRQAVLTFGKNNPRKKKRAETDRWFDQREL